MFSETPVIHKYNGAQILLTDAVPSKLSSCISHFSTSEQSCIYHAGVYSSVLPQVLNSAHINSDSCAQGAHSMISKLLNTLHILEIQHLQRSQLSNTYAKRTHCSCTPYNLFGFCCPVRSTSITTESLAITLPGQLPFICSVSNHNITGRISR